MYAQAESQKKHKGCSVKHYIFKKSRSFEQNLRFSNSQDKSTIQRKRPYDSAHTIEMNGQNINYNRNNLLLTVRNKYSIGPQYFFLESGSESAGGWHAINRHLTQFMQPPYNISSGDQLAKFIDDQLTGGDYSIRKTDRGYEVKIEVDNSHFMRIQVGSNGFIVTAIPESENTLATNHPGTF